MSSLRMPAARPQRRVVVVLIGVERGSTAATTFGGRACTEGNSREYRGRSEMAHASDDHMEWVLLTN